MSHSQPPRIESWIAASAGRIDRLPRLVRIVLSMVITILLTALIWLLLNLLYDEPGARAPVIAAVVAGMGLYVYGWWALVGFDSRAARTWRAGPPAVAYLLAGMVSLVMIVVAVVVIVA